MNKHLQQNQPPDVYGGFIAYRLKVIPEDFRVTEVASLTPGDMGPHRIYRLTKSGWNTTDVLDRVARKNKIPYSELSYGGKKDRHALTVQYVSSRNPADLSCQDKDWSFEFVGLGLEPMSPDKILKNRFDLTLRSLHGNEIPILQRNIKKYRESLFPNYFDRQRFGCAHPHFGLPGIQILRGEYEMALQAALGCYHSGAKGNEKKRKNELIQNWGDWGKLALISSGFEKRIFELFKQTGQRKPDSGTLAKALQFVPSEELSMYFSAAQSRIWDGMVQKWIHRNLPSVRIKNGTEDPSIPLSPVVTGEDLKLSLPGPGARFEGEFIDFFSELLGENNIVNIQYNVPGLKGSFFSSYERSVFIKADNLLPASIDNDELYSGRKKAQISFSLPSGSYATMLVKCLTLRNEWDVAGQ